MKIDNYLIKYQSTVYKSFSNAIKTNKLSHAYLLSGSNGMPLKQAAIFLGKSLLCDSPNPLACNNCITCMRIDEGNYPDMMVFGDDASTIKKENVERIINNFNKVALETKGIMVYVLHLVETMTPIAVNSLLKFLEEPGKNIYAFLTTENESKVLPTIISRTQVLRFNLVKREQIIEDAMKLGVLKEDAELLSAVYNDDEKIKEVSESETYNIVKQALLDQLNALLLSPDDAMFSCNKFVVNKIKTGEQIRLYLKLLIEVFQNLVNLSMNENIILTCYDILNELSKNLKHLDKSLLEITIGLNQVDYNVNIGLLLNHITYVITKED